MRCLPPTRRAPTLYAASIAGTLVMGAKAGERQLRLFGAPARQQDEEGERLKNASGFELDAAVRVAADDRQGRERASGALPDAASVVW